MVHLTNGDSALEGIRATGLPGIGFSWQDMLHDGPVPRACPLEEFSERRSHFLASLGEATQEQVRAEFRRRDAAMHDSLSHDEIILWFEHDLYDQLQLLQILDWYASHRPAGRLSLIQADDYLGPMDAPTLAALFPNRQPVRPEQIELAQRAWDAFSSPDPTALVALTREDCSELPYLRAALIRQLEEYPSVRNGLSRSEQQLLATIAEGHDRRDRIYRRFQMMEQPVFLGDSPVWVRLDRLEAGPTPALTSAPYRLTALGEQLLKAQADWVAVRGRPDCWIGGVDLAQCSWRWDAAASTLVS